MTLRSKPSSCIGCACASHGTDFSAIEGTGSLGVMDIGEGSGEHEARDQLPFRPYAPAGSVRERIFKRMSLDREQFSTTNVLRCRPRNNWLEGAPWEFSAIQHCRPNLEAAIVERKPRCLHALGGLALRELTGMAGAQQGITHLAGYVLPSRIGTLADGSPVPVIGNFHPAYLRRGKASHQGVYARILRRAIIIAAGKDRAWAWDVDPDDPTTWPGLNYLLHPSLDEALGFWRYAQQNSHLPIAQDIETFESLSLDEDSREGFVDTEIRQVQFAVETPAGPWAIALPYTNPYRPIIINLLHLMNPKYGHNWWLFDERVLQAAAAREGWTYNPAVRTHDTLQTFHHWQPDLPAHLQFASSFIQFPFPWKHLAASNLEFYGCCDVHSNLLLGIMLEKTLKRDGLWGDRDTGYYGQVYEVRPVLAAMEKRGLPIDDDERLKLGAEFDKAQEWLRKDILSKAPSGLGRVQPKEGYKGVPPEVKRAIADGHHEMVLPALRYKDDDEEYHYEQREFPIADVDPATGEPVTSLTTRWCRVYDFNPNSRPQVLAYMKAKGHPVPKSREEDEEGNRKDTTQEKELRRLASKTGDLFYLQVVEYRGFTKLRGTYIDGFVPGSDGCVHTTFTFDTAIGQLSSRNPNTQNFTKLKPTPRLAKAMRRMIAAKPGKILFEWDYKSCHVLTLGFLAEDPTWMRLARLDMHSFVAGHVLGLWDGPTILKESDEQLMERFRWLKSDPERKRVRDDQAKHGILGIGNGLMAKGLYERYMENFPPQPCKDCSGSGVVKGVRGPKRCFGCHSTGLIPGMRVAQRFLDALQRLAPRIFAYQRQERRNAHEQGDRGVITPFAFVRRFYEVYTFSKRWNPSRDLEPPHGDQAEQAVSFRHTNVAHCHVRSAMKELYRLGLDEKYGLCNQIHDSLLFHFDKAMLDEHVAEVRPVLAAPSRILKHARIAPEGLQIDVEGSFGRNWAEMDEIKAAREVPA